MSQHQIAAPRTRRIVWAILGVAVALIIFIFLDHQRMPVGLLPAEWYCHLAVGQWVTETGRTTPFCKHGTIWGAILGRKFYVAP
jgi:hypothetical protein